MLECIYQNPRDWRLHLFFWFLYAEYYVVVNQMNGLVIDFVQLICSVALFAGVCYSTFWILNRFITAGKYLEAFVIVFLLLLGIACVVYLFTYIILPAFGIIIYRENATYTHMELGQTVIRLFGRYGSIGVCYYLLVRIIDYAKQLHLSSLQKEDERKIRVSAENARNRFEFRSLSGIVPVHLLANLTSRWSALLSEVNRGVSYEIEQTYQLVLYFMRSYEANSPLVVPMENELKVLWINVDLLRKSTHTGFYINLDLPDHPEGATIPPTTLITFLENAIKHGVHSDPKKPINMTVKLVSDGYFVRCRNEVARGRIQVSHGVGLSNLKRRLELVYDNKFNFQYRINQSVFESELFIAE